MSNNDNNLFNDIDDAAEDMELELAADQVDDSDESSDIFVDIDGNDIAEVEETHPMYKMDISKELTALERIHNMNATYKWGTVLPAPEPDYIVQNPIDEQVGDRVKFGKGSVRIWNTFEGIEVCRSVAFSAKGKNDEFPDSWIFGKGENAKKPTPVTRQVWNEKYKRMEDIPVRGGALDSFEKVKDDLVKAHNFYPESAHGEHCNKDQASRDKCLFEEHHKGWWHSNAAYEFSMGHEETFTNTDLKPETIHAGVRDLQQLMVPHSSDTIHGEDMDEYECQDPKCETCAHNREMMESWDISEARHNPRPAKGERLHSQLHAKLCTTSHHVIRIEFNKAISDDRPGDLGFKRVLSWPRFIETNETYGEPYNFTRVIPVDAKVTWIKYSHEMSTHPMVELGEGQYKSEDQNRIDRQWRETDDVVEPSEDRVHTSTEKTQDKIVIAEGSGVKTLFRYRRWKIIGTWIWWYNGTPLPCGSQIRRIKLSSLMLKDTGRLPEAPDRPRMNVPKPFLFVDMVQTQYKDSAEEAQRFHALSNARKALLKAIVSEDPAEREKIQHLKDSIVLLENNPRLTQPRTYLLNNKVWADSGGTELPKDLFNAARNKARNLVKDMSDWGSSWGEYDDISLPKSFQHTEIALAKKLIGPGSGYPDITELPEPILIKANEPMRNGKVVLNRLGSNGNYPLGNLPLKKYHCWVCNKVTPHIRDVWQANRFQGAQFHDDIYGKSGHTKCMNCGSVLMRKALKVSVRFKLSNKEDAAIWTVTGYLFGDGFFKEWLDYISRPLNNIKIWETLELARTADAMLRLNPVLKAQLTPKPYSAEQEMAW